MKRHTVSRPFQYLLMVFITMALGCEVVTGPESPMDDPAAPGVAPDKNIAIPRAGQALLKPAKPIRGTFFAAEPVWLVSHFSEQSCGGLVAGAEVQSRGSVSHLGQVSVDASAAWDWSVPAAGDYAPQGSTTGPSATIFATYPYDFCSAAQSARGSVVFICANGDELSGRVAGGEVYELGFEVAGDGQEQFMHVVIDGGTGRFTHASGEMVLHMVARFAMFEFLVLSSEILPGGWIQY